MGGEMSETKTGNTASTSQPCLSVPPHRQQALTQIDRLLHIMERLLAPDGCPWDREQTLDTLRPYLLEETYEVLESMDDPNLHRVELGDLLLQIVFQSALREKEGTFAFGDVAAAISDKMIRRHPHVFGPASDAKALDPDDVRKQWEAIKAQEIRDGEPSSKSTSHPLFKGIPKTMPALTRAFRVQDKAAALGFDWPDVEGPRRKVDEEWAELQEAIDGGDIDAIREELGDVLFILVRLGQKFGIDAEGALSATIAKFQNRFTYVLKRCEEEDVSPETAGLAKLDAYWEQAKALQKKKLLK
jgi:MazG family protein